MDKLPESNIKVESKSASWIKNYWYYYKWRVIAVVFAVIVVAVCAGQMCSNSRGDIKIIYAGSYPSSGGMVPGMADAFSVVIPDEYSDGGSKKASLVMFTIYSDEQIEALKESEGIVIDSNNNRQELGKFKDTVVSSDAYLCMVDPTLYEVLDELGVVMPLSEVLGYTPEYAVDGKAIRLSDTEFGQYFESFKVLSETYLCVRSPGVIQNATGRGEKSYEFECAQELLKQIVEYKAPEE